MADEVETSSFDTRFASYRVKKPAAEKALLSSILQHGIRDPLQGVDTKNGRILLDGFKRYRCAGRLSIAIVPYRSLGSDEASGIIELIRIANVKNINILEQAILIEELKTVYNMSISEIAGLLEKSKGWVGMRAGLIKEMSECVLNKIFSGQFPAYSFMYTLRKFIRMNSIKKEEVDEFVKSVSGKNLSIRDIGMLAHSYFSGSVEFRRQIRNGNISWGLNFLKENPQDTTECTKLEWEMLKTLEIIQKYIHRVTCKSKDNRLKSNSFFAQANLLAGAILKQMDNFGKAMEQFYDKSGQT